MYVDFCIGPLGFMDGDLVLPGNMPEAATPEIAARFEELVKMDKPAFFTVRLQGYFICRFPCAVFGKYRGNNG